MRAFVPLTLTALLTLSCGSNPATGGGGSSSTGAGTGGSSSSGTETGSTSGSMHSGSGASSANGGASSSNGGGSSSNGGAAGTGGGANGGGGQNACAAGVEPDATNTGVPAGVTLTTVNQDVVVTQDGTVIDAQDIHGFLTIQASHVKVSRSIVRGHATTATTAIIRIDSGTDISIEDTEVSADTPSVDVDGVWGSNFVGRRLNIHGSVDGMKLESNSTVECSFIHDLTSFASDPNQGGGATHNDCIQILDGTTIQIVGNQLLAATNDNSAIQVTQDFGMVGDLHITANWADGGGCTYNFSHKGGDSLTGVFTTDNRFGRNSFFNCPILKSTKTTLVSMGDVWNDTGMPVPIQTHD